MYLLKRAAGVLDRRPVPANNVAPTPDAATQPRGEAPEDRPAEGQSSTGFPGTTGSASGKSSG